MEIIYKPNPLATVVKLTDHEREILWHKIKFQECEDLMHSAHFHLTDGQFKDVDRAIKYLEPSYYMKDDGKSPLDQRVDKFTSCYLDELASIHGGDCTCFPASCMKCHVESLLGIDTLKPYPGKHVLYKIYNAFSYKDNNEWKQHSLAEALDLLKNYDQSVKIKPEAWKNHTQAEYDSYVPKWIDDAKKAYSYLLNYAKEHNML